MKTTIFIPKKIKIGFNKRNDTYTGKLGYIIYHDGSKWRKESSWDGWREHYINDEEFQKKKLELYNKTKEQMTLSHKSYCEYYQKNPTSYASYKPYAEMTTDEYLKKHLQPYNDFPAHGLGRVSSDESIKPVEYENKPLDGFVLNKKAGGYSSGWNHRQTYCRVYDPRGFEFEITIPNLLYILENSTSIKGKGLEGKFIYGWDGKDLVLIPEDSPEFKEMVEFTQIQELKVKKKDLKPGSIYLTSGNQKATYLTEDKYYDYNGVTSGNKVLWFYNPEGYPKFAPIGIDSIKKEVDTNPDLATLLDKLEKDSHFRPKQAKIETFELYKKKEIEDIVNNNYYRSYSEIYVPAKQKDKYKRVYIIREYDWKDSTANYYYGLKYSRNGEMSTNKFASIDLLLMAHPLYKKVNIKENEEKEQ